MADRAPGVAERGVKVERAQRHAAAHVGLGGKPQRRTGRVGDRDGLSSERQGLGRIVVPLDQARTLQRRNGTERRQAVGGGQGLRRLELLQSLVGARKRGQLPGADDCPVAAPERRRPRRHDERRHVRLQRREVRVLAVALADLTQCAGQRQRHVGRGAAGTLEQHRDIGARPRRQNTVVVRDRGTGPGEQPVVALGRGAGAGGGQDDQHARGMAVQRRLQVFGEHHGARGGGSERQVGAGQRALGQRGHLAQRVGRFGRQGLERHR